MSDPAILHRDHWPIDHFVLGVPDTEKAVRDIAVRTGVEIALKPPEKGQFYWSGGIMLGGGAFLELLGPNPAHRKWHPLTAAVRQFTEPRPVFWYIGTLDFDLVADRVRKLGYPIEREEVVGNAADDSYARYRRGVIGPGIASARPMVIEWHHRPPRMDPPEPECRIVDFSLRSPKARQLTTLFDALGIRQGVIEGPQRLELHISSPLGTLSFAGPGLQIESHLDWLTTGIRLLAGGFSRSG